ARGVPLWRHLRDLAGQSGTAFAPLPMIQIFGGGRHAGNRIDIQDYLVIALGRRSFAEAAEMTAEVYMAAAAAMAAAGKLNGIADEGGVWPDFTANEAGLEALTRAIEVAGLRAGTDMGIALDVAASSFFDNGRYLLALDDRRLDTA